MESKMRHAIENQRLAERIANLARAILTSEHHGDPDHPGRKANLRRACFYQSISAALYRKARRLLDVEG